MLLEKRDDIVTRQQAARKWLEAYAERKLAGENQPSGKCDRALMVLVLTEKTSDFLAEFDPQALKQAQSALDGTSWEDYMKKRKRNER